MTRVVFSMMILFCSFITVAQPATGAMAPDIALEDVNGKTVNLSSLKGKVVLVDFWASWCGPCRITNRRLATIYPKLKAKGFEIYSISIDENKADWKKAIATDKIQWLQVNEKGWNGAVSLAWKIEQIPSTWLLDKEGKVVAVDPEGKALERKINELLN
jgi:peroxiredoxin